jgi:fatty acid desaturase
MKHEDYPIPAKLNLLICILQITALLSLFWIAAHVSGWWLALVALGYGLIMNSAYAMLHEAEHGILHPWRKLNNLLGATLALFFPAPFHLIRQGHLGHHLRNHIISMNWDTCRSRRRARNCSSRS